jgi:hypothetical protein
LRIEDVAPELEEWKATAAEEFYSVAKVEWKEWGREWLLPYFFKKRCRLSVQEIKEKYAFLMKEVAGRFKRGEIDVEETMEAEDRLEVEKKEEMKEASDWDLWKSRIAEEEEDIEEVQEEAKAKGKGKAKVGSKVTKARKGRRVESEEEEEEEKSVVKGKSAQKSGGAKSRSPTKASKKSLEESRVGDGEEAGEGKKGVTTMPRGWYPQAGEKVSSFVSIKSTLTNNCL